MQKRSRKALSRVARVPMAESLETRRLFSELATAQLSLVSTDPGATPVYHYAVTVTDAGTTNIGTFWLAWRPGEDFLPSIPSSVSNPSGWSNTLTGSGNSTDGTAIEWTATSNAITPGHSLSGFNFVTTDSPTVLAGNSSIGVYQGTPILTSFVYSGAAFSDAGYQFQVSPAVTTTASQTTLISSSPTATAGDSVTFTATVNGSGPTPTGDVTFAQDGNILGTINVQSNGTAAFTTSDLPVGTDHITATYNGDTNYSASASSAVTQTIQSPANAVATTLALVSDQPSEPQGQAVEITATVTPAVSGPAPTGTVSFTVDGLPGGSGAVAADGTVLMEFSSLPVGTHSIIATYTGDGVYATSTSAPLEQVITQPPTLVPAIASSKLPTAAVSGAAIKGSLKLAVTNQTSAPVKGKSTIVIYASTSGIIDGTSIIVAQLSKSLTVNVGKPASASISIKLAAGALPAGNYTLLARLTDPSGIVNDSATGPTISLAAPFIVLSETVTKNALPSTGASGAKSHGSVTLSLTNSGNITTPGTTTVALFATADGTIDGSSIQLASQSKKLKIKPGKSSRVSVSLKQLPTIAAGSYTVVAQVTDPNGQITSTTVGLITLTA